MAKPIPALRNLKTAQMVKVCTDLTFFLDYNLQAVSSPVADYVKNNPVPHLVRCFISAVMNSLPRDECFYPEIQECCSQGGSETTRFNPDGGDFCVLCHSCIALAQCVSLSASIALAQVEGNKENLAMPACPLPANTYTSAHLFQETRHAPHPGWQKNLSKNILLIKFNQCLNTVM